MGSGTEVPTLSSLLGRSLNIALSGYEISAISGELDIRPRAFSILINRIKYVLTGRNRHRLPQLRMTCDPNLLRFEGES